MNIPFLSFEYINRQVKAETMEVFERFFDKAWYILGDEVKKFELAYAEYNHTAYAVGVSNGLDALHIALKALGIGEGDEVIVPSNTYIATLLAVSYVGAKPVLVEPDPATYNIYPVNIEKAITAKTKAILPVHLYGQACDMASIMQIAGKYNLSVVEDNAQAHGATFNGRMTGSWGHINATSFYPGKNLGAFGDAGGITTNDAILADKAKVLRNYGSHKKYFNETIGFNMRLDECQAAFLTLKLKYINEWTTQRQEIAGWYNGALKGVGDLVLPAVANGATHVYHLYVIRTAQRNQLQEYLTANNIGTLIHYPLPPHLQQAYQHLEHQKGDFPMAENIADTCLSLPIWPGMEQTHVELVSDQIRKFFSHN